MAKAPGKELNLLPSALKADALPLRHRRERKELQDSESVLFLPVSSAKQPPKIIGHRRNGRGKSVPLQLFLLPSNRSGAELFLDLGGILFDTVSLLPPLERFS